MLLLMAALNTSQLVVMQLQYRHRLLEGQQGVSMRTWSLCLPGQWPDSLLLARGGCDITARG